MGKFIALYKTAKTYTERESVRRQAYHSLSASEYAIFFNIVSKFA